MKNSRTRGYTLIELIVSVGLFALIMTLASGAYLVMINTSRHTQAIALGIDNLAFAVETITRTIRTSTHYSCDGGDCPVGGSTFSSQTIDGEVITFSSSGGAITQDGVALTDPSVTVTDLTFYTRGTAPGDDEQPRTIILVSGTVSSGPGKTIPFAIQSEATMRGTDI